MSRLRAWWADLPTLLRVGLRRGLLKPIGPRAGLAGLSRLVAGRQDAWVAVSVWAHRTPNAPAASDAAHTLSYRALQRHIRAFAGVLARAGVRPGQRVGLVCENRISSWIVQGACAELGAVPALVSPHWTDAELEPRLAGLAHLVAPPDRHPRCAAVLGVERVSAPPDPGVEPPATRVWRARLRAARPRRGREDLVLHTSGTSGQPKGARLSSASWGPAMPFALLDRLDLPVGVTLYTPCPIYHAAPQLLCGLAFVLGGHVVIAARLDPGEAADVWRRQGVTHALLVPTLLDRLVASAASLPPLRGILSAGAPLGVATWAAATRRFGPIVHDLYGATELGVVSVATPDDLAAAPGTVGRPLPGVAIAIRDAEGKPVADGAVGTLYVASSMQMLGYEGLDAPGAWSTVGDLARLEGGRLFLVGRDREMILTGGVNVFPGEVEAVLKAHPAVAEAAVVGVPDPTWGERVEAHVVTRGPVAVASLHSWCDERLARFKRPKAIHLRDTLPMSPTGKVLKRLLVPLETT